MRATLLALVLCLPLVAAAQTATVPVATWLNDTAHEPVGDRVVAVMRARGLHPVVTCSVGCTLSVPSAESAAAMSIGQELVVREGLDIELVAMRTS